MRRETTGIEGNSIAFVLNLDEELTAYLDQQAAGDPNAYLVQLLREAQERQQRKGKNSKTSVDELNANTPDTSGYPEMKGHFGEGTST